MVTSRRRPRSVAAWRRRRHIYERHQAGQTYRQIAQELGISPARVRELANAWRRLANRLAQWPEARQEWEEVFSDE